jgi:antitoxin component of MazEF toxin-antitoxin module
MSDYIGTVIKAGNSYAVRVPKAYLTNSKLKVGQKVQLAKDPTSGKGNVAGAVAQLQKLADERGSMKSIRDAANWQTAIRDEVHPWSTVIRDIGR